MKRAKAIAWAVQVGTNHRVPFMSLLLIRILKKISLVG